MTKVLSVANQKGGVGKTTITALLACSLALNQKKKVLVLDCDNQASITDVRNVEKQFLKGDPPFDIIRISPEKVLKNLKEYVQYDIVFIDIPRFTSTRNDSGAMKMLYLCDAVLIPFLGSPTDYFSTVAFVEALEKLSKAEHKEDFFYYGFLNQRRRLKMEKDAMKGLKNKGLPIFDNYLSSLVRFNDFSTYKSVLSTKAGKERFEPFYKEFLEKFEIT